MSHLLLPMEFLSNLSQEFLPSPLSFLELLIKGVSFQMQAEWRPRDLVFPGRRKGRVALWVQEIEAPSRDYFKTPSEWAHCL